VHSEYLAYQKSKKLKRKTPKTRRETSPMLTRRILVNAQKQLGLENHVVSRNLRHIEKTTSYRERWCFLSPGFALRWLGIVATLAILFFDNF